MGVTSPVDAKSEHLIVMDNYVSLKSLKMDNHVYFFLHMCRRGFIGFKSSHISQKKKSHNRKFKC